MNLIAFVTFPFMYVALVKSLNQGMKEQKCYYSILPVDLDQDLTVVKVKGKVTPGDGVIGSNEPTIEECTVMHLNQLPWNGCRSSGLRSSVTFLASDSLHFCISS